MFLEPPGYQLRFELRLPGTCRRVGSVSTGNNIAALEHSFFMLKIWNDCDGGKESSEWRGLCIH